MNLVRQPPQSNLCGQACIATICGITLEEAIALMKTKGKTSTSHLITALKVKGFHPTVGLTRKNKTSGFTWPDDIKICKFKTGKASHWVVRHNDKFYDPAAGVFREVPKYLTNSGAKLVSYLVVFREPKFGMEGYAK